MSQPVLDTVAQELYSALAPLAVDDETNGWALAYLCRAAGAMFQPVDDLVRDGDEGSGWSELLDVEDAPEDALAWLGQFVGVALDPSLDEAGWRTQISAESGFARGTLATFQAAAAKHLTGAKIVIVRERVAGDAYKIEAITYTDQTPDSAVTLADMVAAKPAGLVLDYEVHDGQDFFDLKSNYHTFADVSAHYANFAAVRDDEPTGP